VEFQHRGGATQPAPADEQPRAEFERELAHKLGNLLQVVNGNLELAAARVDDERLRGYLANAQEAAEQLTELAHGLVGHLDATGR
jgi:two-component sensor histidine kinase